MPKYWSFSGIVAGVTLLVHFIPLALVTDISQHSNASNYDQNKPISYAVNNNRVKRDVSESDSNGGKINQVGIEIVKIQYKFPNLDNTRLPNVAENSNIVELNDSISDLKKFVHDTKEDLKAAVNKIDEITQKLSSVGTTLDTILSNDTVGNVQSRQFPVVNDQPSNTEDYKSVVRKIYNNQIDNFDSVLNFVDSVKFDILNALYNEMKANGHKDFRKLLQLSESVQKATSNSLSDSIVAKTRSLIGNLSNEILEETIGHITDAFLNGNSWPMVKQLTATINSSCVHCVDNIYTKVVENLLDEVNATDILKQAKTNLKCLDECVSIHQAIFNSLDSSSSSYSDTVISLARHIQATMDDPRYKNIHPDMQTRHKEIKNKLPLSVKNAVFLSLVCIKNTAYNEYLYASSWHLTPSGLKEAPLGVSDSTLRSVFTWIPSSSAGYIADNKDKWALSALDDNKFIIINEQFDEHLYLPSTSFDRNGRIPYTINQPSITDTSSQDHWSFEVNGDNVYIKNLHQNEFLFARSAPHNDDSDRRWVLTFIPISPTSYAGIEWEITNCTDSHSST